MTEEEDRVEYADQNNALRRQFDSVLTEPIPAQMFMKRPAWLDYARAAVLVGFERDLAVLQATSQPAASEVSVAFGVGQ